MTQRRSSSGGRVDRTRTIRFTFDGRQLTGHPGDTLAREVSDESWPQIADRMTPAQAAVSGDADPEAVEDIAARMFRA